jgi:AcrR family transcriptional regulator
MTTLLTRPRRADVRSRILEAAATVFLERGYAEATVSEIAAAAGFTKGAVYSNFGGKPELFSTVFAERTASIAGTTIAVSRALEPNQPTERLVAAIAASLTEQVTNLSRWPSALAEFRALAVRDETVRTSYARLRLRQRSLLEEQLRAQAQALRLPAGFDYPVAAHLLLTVTNALAAEFAAAPESTPAELIQASLVRLLASLLP